MTPTPPRRPVIVFLMLFSALLATGAHAAEPPSEADKTQAAELKRVADEAMLDLRYPEALDGYNKAYKLDPKPALRYNRGRALQALGRFPEALDELEGFKREAPDELKQRVPLLDQLIAEVRAKVSTVTITSNVAGAAVLIRDQRVGRTPLAGPVRVNAGKATIELSKEGYVTFKKSIVLPGGGSLTVDAPLVPRGNTGVLAITSPQAGAMVYVDGKQVGTVPAETTLRAGKHTLRVTADGYEDAETTAVVKAGARKTIEVTLKETTPIYQTWWLWTGIGAVVATGVVVTAALLIERPPDSGDIPPGTVAVGTAALTPLLRF